MSFPKRAPSLVRFTSSTSASSLRRANGHNRFRDHFNQMEAATTTGVRSRKSRIRMNATEIYSNMRSNIVSGKFQKNLEIAQRIYEDPNGTRYIEPQLYLLLLESIAVEKSRTSASLALQLLREVSDLNCSQEELEQASFFLYQCFENCDDFSQLLGLKMIYQGIIANTNPSLTNQLRYLSCHMHVYLNTGQGAFAMDHFETCIERFKHGKERTLFFEIFPIERLLKSLCSAQDCDSISTVIRQLFCETDTLTHTFDWSEVLGLALWKNDYNLVKLIYTNVIMDGLDVSVSDENILNFDSTSGNSFLSSLSEETLQQILHTFAINGDVSSCLELIEWHYIHKSMKGEKALTKELCLEVTRAYCCHASPLLESTNETDGSVKTILDVIENFISRKRHNFHYKDFVDALSHRFSIYKAHDAKVAKASRRETTIQPLSFGEPFVSGEDILEEDVLLEKRSNRNAHVSTQGSVLKNTEILQKFIFDHLKYIVQKQYSQSTLQIFVNCLLSHLATHQNTTGIVLALETMSTAENVSLGELLDENSYDIIVYSLSKSPAAMATGLELYNHMKKTGRNITTKNYQDFILSSLRGDGYNQLLEFYVFELLCLKPKYISAKLLQRIRSFKRLNEEGMILLKILEDFGPTTYESLTDIWDAYNFCKEDPKISIAEFDFKLHHIDQRDKSMLQKVLSS